MNTTENKDNMNKATEEHEEQVNAANAPAEVSPAPEAVKKPKTKAQKIIDIVTYVLVGIVAVFAIFTLVMTLTSKNDEGVSNFFGTYMFSVQSESMEPDIKVGDMVISKRVAASQLKEGDVISFTHYIKNSAGHFQAEVVTHEIYKVLVPGKTFQTKGINNETYDQDPALGDENRFEDIEAGSILGIYQYRIPLLGGIMDFLQKPLGFGLVIVLPAGLFFAYRAFVLIKLLVEMGKEKKKSEQEKTDELVKEAEELRRKLAELEAKSTAADGPKSK